MDERPIFPEESSASVPAEKSEAGAGAADPINPFAPVPQTAGLGSETEISRGSPRVELPPEYWGVVGLAFAFSIVLITIMPGLGVPAMFALIMGTIRVPFIQRRLTRADSERVLPRPLVLLVTSCVFMLMAGFASFFAFCLVCVPAGMLTLTGASGGNEEVAIGFVFGASGLIGLSVFLMLFLYSLRLPI